MSTNSSALARHEGSREDAMTPDALHEEAVADFLRQAAEKDPERVAAVCRRHLVLSENALRYRRGREEALSAARADWMLHAGLDGRKVDV